MQAGDRLGEYVLQERIGEGGFGEVWKASNPDLAGPVVAIKVPTKPDCAAALRREGALQNVVDHPNVVRTITVNAAHDPPYLVSEYVPGESLRRRLDRTKRLAPVDALGILAQVLSALDAAHRAGVVHRDVKPENVLLGPDGVAKLSDFGLGRITESVASSMALSRGRSLTEGGGIVGTYHYMSPEQMKGQPVDLRSDLYACGVMLYEMLTGEAHPIRIPVEGVSQPISAIVDQALRSDPIKRFQSAAHMTSALEAAVPHVPLIDSDGRFVGKAAGRPSGTIEADTDAPGGWAALRSPVGPARPAQRVVPSPPRPRTALLPRVAPGCALIIGVVAAAVIGMAVFATKRRSEAMRLEMTRQTDEEMERQRMQGEELARQFPSLPEDPDLDRPLIGSYPGSGGEPAWVSALRQAQRELENQEYERAEANLRKAISGSGAGADCDAVANPYLQEAYVCAARAQAKLSNPDLAFANLEHAISLGFRDSLRLLAESDLASLRKDPRWKKTMDRLSR